MTKDEVWKEIYGNPMKRIWKEAWKEVVNEVGNKISHIAEKGLRHEIGSEIWYRITGKEIKKEMRTVQ